MNAKIKCRKCGICCCGDMGPIVFLKDVQLICDIIDVGYNDFLEQYCDSFEVDTKMGKIEVYFLKMIDKKCIFLTYDNLCKIYEIRPYQCIHAPYNFMAHYEYWRHMPCVKKEDFYNINSEKFDKEMFEQLIEDGY